eukprot:gene7401-8653_t
MYKLSIIFVIVATIVAVSLSVETDVWELAACNMNSTQVYGTIYIGLTDAEQPTYSVWVNLKGPTGSNILIDKSNHAITVHDRGDLSITGPVYSDGKTFGCDEPNTFPGFLGDWESTTTGINAHKEFTQIVLNGAKSLVGRVLSIYSTHSSCISDTTPPPAPGAPPPALPPTLPLPKDIIGSCVIGIANVNSTTLPDDVKIALPDDGKNTTLAFASTNNAHCNPANAATSAVCYLSATYNLYTYVTGYITLTLSKDKTTMTYIAIVNGLNNSIAHGIHIHTFGDLSDVAGSSTGGHWKNITQVHALPENNNREYGDLGNMCVFGKENVTYYNYTTSYSGTFTTANNVIGRSIVIHAIRDSGDSSDLGARLAQCVIGLGSEDSTPIKFNDVVSGNFTDEPLCTPPPVPTPTPNATQPTPTPSNGTTTSSANSLNPSNINIIVIIALLSFVFF